MLEERVTDQVYSLDDGRFLPDRYIVGTCPHCGYERANGDQCENCARLLEPSDLINPRSAVSGSTRLEVRATRHLFIRQSLMAGRVREWIDSQTDWPILVTSIARNWLNVGLEDRSITRDLKWGIPVGWPGFEGKVFYVWFDAPIEYIGATKEWADLDPATRDWRSWWFDADDVRYTEFLGKDNIPFHTINFPITIMGSGEPWKLVDYIKGFNYLTYQGGQFSTSQKRGVFMDAALEILPGGLLAIRAPGGGAGVGRQRVHVGELREHGQQGPRGHFRQLRAAHPQAGREALRTGGARRWRTRAGGSGARRLARRRSGDVRRGDGRHAVPARGICAAQPLDARESVPRPMRTVARDGSRAGCLHPAHRHQRGAHRGNRLGALRSLRVRAPCRRARTHRGRALVAGRRRATNC